MRSSEGLLKMSLNSASGDIVGGSGSLKGKLIGLEDGVKRLTDDMIRHKQEVQVLRSEKDALESALNLKVISVRKNLMNEISRVEEEMKRNFVHQKSENTKLQQQITGLKNEKTALQQHLLALQRRITDLENQIGNEEH